MLEATDVVNVGVPDARPLWQSDAPLMRARHRTKEVELGGQIVPRCVRGLAGNFRRGRTVGSHRGCKAARGADHDGRACAEYTRSRRLRASLQLVRQIHHRQIRTAAVVCVHGELPCSRSCIALSAAIDAAVRTQFVAVHPSRLVFLTDRLDLRHELGRERRSDRRIAAALDRRTLPCHACAIARRGFFARSQKTQPRRRGRSCAKPANAFAFRATRFRRALWRAAATIWRSLSARRAGRCCLRSPLKASW